MAENAQIYMPRLFCVKINRKSARRMEAEYGINEVLRWKKKRYREHRCIVRRDPLISGITPETALKKL
ncbi:MAG: hypothetical protein ACLUAR_17910 [Pilosibacter sp.]